MEEKINNQIKYLRRKWFIVSDVGKVGWYLEKVWLHRLRRYFNTVDKYEWTDFQEIINSYIFDKEFRNINLWLLEIIENSFKNQFILNFEDYLNPELYNIKYKDSRLSFLYNKISILKRKDSEIKNNLNTDLFIPVDLFVDKLQFWEIFNIYLDLKIEYQIKISNYYGIDYKLFNNWMKCISYLRNLCSHWENIYNKKFTFSIIAKELFLEFNIKENNTYISYFYILSYFKEFINPEYKWEDILFKNMIKYNILLKDFWAKKETFHSQLDSEAWKVLVKELYEKHLKKPN